LRIIEVVIKIIEMPLINCTSLTIERIYKKKQIRDILNDA